jgi:hypothetical protein
LVIFCTFLKYENFLKCRNWWFLIHEKFLRIKIGDFVLFFEYGKFSQSLIMLNLFTFCCVSVIQKLWRSLFDFFAKYPKHEKVTLTPFILITNHFLQHFQNSKNFSVIYWLLLTIHLKIQERPFWNFFRSPKKPKKPKKPPKTH